MDEIDGEDGEGPELGGQWAAVMREWIRESWEGSNSGWDREDDGLKKGAAGEKGKVDGRRTGEGPSRWIVIVGIVNAVEGILGFEEMEFLWRG